MDSRLDALFADWHRLDGAVLLAHRPPEAGAPDPETLIAESTAWCRHSSRLMWVVLDWMARHADELDPGRLLDLTLRRGDVSVLGLLCDMALQHGKDSVLRIVREACSPNPNEEIFFHRVARSPLATELSRLEALDVYRRWNYIGRELVHLTEQKQEA